MHQQPLLNKTNSIPSSVVHKGFACVSRLLALSALLALSSAANSQTPHWSAVPEHVSRDLSFFQQLFEDANTDGFGITVLGDSQETTFGGAGRDYISALNQEFFSSYGNLPSTAVVPPSTFVHGWNLSSANQGSLSTSDGQGSLATSIATELPGVRISEFSNSPAIPTMGCSTITLGRTSNFSPAWPPKSRWKTTTSWHSIRDCYRRNWDGTLAIVTSISSLWRI